MPTPMNSINILVRISQQSLRRAEEDLPADEKSIISIPETCKRQKFLPPLHFVWMMQCAHYSYWLWPRWSLSVVSVLRSFQVCPQIHFIFACCSKCQTPSSRTGLSSGGRDHSASGLVSQGLQKASRGLPKGLRFSFSPGLWKPPGSRN